MAGGVVDDGDLDAHAVQLHQRRFQVQHTDLHEMRRLVLAGVPPVGKASLRIGIDQGDGAAPARQASTAR